MLEMNMVETVQWLRCSCGVTYQKDPQEIKKQSDEYVASFKAKKFYEKSFEYISNIYLPFIEEYTYGRRFLEINPIDPFVAEIAKKRGWISYTTSDHKVDGVESIPEDFETFELGEECMFDLVWSYHDLQRCVDYKSVISKIYNHLNKRGMVFIAVPDAAFIDIEGPQNFPVWFRDNRVILSKDVLVRQLQAAGFEVILAKRNTSSRFVKNNDLHIIAQKGAL